MENVELIKLKLSLGHNENIVGEVTFCVIMNDSILGYYRSEIKNTFEIHKDNIELLINKLVNQVSDLLGNQFDCIDINIDKVISCLEIIQKEYPFNALEISYNNKRGTCVAKSKLLGMLLVMASDKKDLRNGAKLHIFKGTMDESKLSEIFDIRNLKDICHQEAITSILDQHEGNNAIWKHELIRQTG